MRFPFRPLHLRLSAACLALGAALGAPGQVAVRARTLHTMAGPPIADGVVVIRDGKIAAVGSAASVQIPAGVKVLEAAVATPGLIDPHSTVGLSGIFNQPQDQDQLERSAPIQPELRAIDAYNPHDRLIEWVRGFGVTTIHTGHAPGELISGQTAILKTFGNTVEEAVVVESGAVAATLSPMAQKEHGRSPGTRGKMMAMLREELIKAEEYARKREKDHQPAAASSGTPASSTSPAATQPAGPPERNLRYETLAAVVRGELPLLITVNRAQDIASALRLAREFKIRLWLDSAAEAYLLIDEIKAAGVPVIVHATMHRATGETENLTFENAARLRRAGIPVAIQSGYESYVPKTRVVLFEAAMAAANGLTFEEALASITIDAARILGVDKRLGSLEVGKDADVALFDGDPFEYTSHCIGTIINGQVAHEKPR